MLTSTLIATSLVVGALAAPNPVAPRAAGGIALPFTGRAHDTYNEYHSLQRRDGIAAANLTFGRLWYYRVPIQIGTPPQDVLVGMTAAKYSNMQIYESGGDERYTVDNGAVSYYYPGNSSTSASTGKNITGTATWNISGVVKSDTVTIGGLTFPDLPFYGQNTSNWAGASSFLNLVGYLGIGFDADPTGDFGDPLWKRVVAQGGAPEAGIYLERAISEGGTVVGGWPSQENAGELMLGGLNAAYYQGSINYMDLDNSTTAEESGGSAYLQLDQIKVNGEALASVNETATSWTPKATGEGNVTYDVSVPGPVMLALSGIVINLGNETFNALHAKIPGATPMGPLINYPIPVYMMNVPCNTTAEVSLTFGGVDYPLRPEDWIWHNHDTPGEGCQSMIVNYPTQSAYIGTPFLQSVYTAFQFEKRQIGFAKVADGLPTRNVSVNGTVTVSVPSATGTASGSSSAAVALHPSSVVTALAVLGVAAASLL